MKTQIIDRVQGDEDGSTAIRLETTENQARAQSQLVVNQYSYHDSPDVEKDTTHTISGRRLYLNDR